LREVLRTDQDGRRIDGPVPETLGRRIVEVLAAWDWSQRPAAVAAIPSVTRPQLVGSLATGIASVGRLEDLGALGLSAGPAPPRAGAHGACRVAGRMALVPPARRGAAPATAPSGWPTCGIASRFRPSCSSAWISSAVRRSCWWMTPSPPAGP